MAKPNKAGARLSAPRLTQATRRVITGIWEQQHEPKGNVAKVPHIRQECRSLCDTCPYKFSGYPLKCSAMERSVASLMLLPRQRFGLVLAFALPSHSAFSTNFLGAIPVPGTMHLYCEPCPMQYQTKPHPKQNLCAPPLQHHGSRQHFSIHAACTAPSLQNIPICVRAAQHQKKTTDVDLAWTCNARIKNNTCNRRWTYNTKVNKTIWRLR